MIVKGEKKGVVLIMVFIIMIALIIIVGAYLYMVSTQTMSAGYDISNAKAFWAAEAGVQMVVYNLKTNSSYRTNLTPNPLTGSLGGGTYSVNVVKVGSNYNLTSIGTCNGINRKITCVVNTSSFFNYAGFGTSSVTMSGNVRTDSYDSSLKDNNGNLVGYNGLLPNGTRNIGHNGDIGGNVDIIVTGGSPYADGNASTGPSGTFSDPTNRYHSGTVTHTNNITLTPVTVPSTLTNLATGGAITAAKTINSGNYKFSQIDIAGSSIVTINATTGPVNIYLTGNATSIDITNGAQITIPAANTYPVTFYVDGSTNVSGAGVLNNTYIPSNVQLFGTGSSAVTVSNSGAFYGAIYAPSASLTVSGNAAVYGSFVGNSITLSNSGKIHYDTSLSGLSLPFGSGTSAYSVKSWNEVVPT